MSDYRRWRVAGGAVFLTLVTRDRAPLLTSDAGRRFLRSAIASVRRRLPFDLFASVLLPDHWHLVMQLPNGDADYSTRIKWIKREFTGAWTAPERPESNPIDSRQGPRFRGVWQPRFWEHTILDGDDLKRCVDYIHWNPRKHGLVTRVRDWPWSSFHRFVEAGEYPLDWGGSDPTRQANQPSWGEP